MVPSLPKDHTPREAAMRSVWRQQARDGTHLRQDRALELWRAGLKLEDIARELGYRGRAGARQAGIASLRRHDERMEDIAGEVRADQLAKLSMLEEKFLDSLLDSVDPDYRVMDALMRLYKRKSELVGADSSIKVDVRATGQAMTEDQLLIFVAKCERRREELESAKTPI